MMSPILGLLFLIISCFASPITENDLIHGLEEESFLKIQSFFDGSIYFVHLNNAKAKSGYIHRILELDSETSSITLNYSPFIIQTIVHYLETNILTVNETSIISLLKASHYLDIPSMLYSCVSFVIELFDHYSLSQKVSFMHALEYTDLIQTVAAQLPFELVQQMINKDKQLKKDIESSFHWKKIMSLYRSCGYRVIFQRSSHGYMPNFILRFFNFECGRALTLFKHDHLRRFGDSMKYPTVSIDLKESYCVESFVNYCQETDNVCEMVESVIIGNIMNFNVLHLSSLPNLLYLELSSIRNLEFKNLDHLPKLQHLKLSSRRLRHFPALHHENLQSLNLYRCKLHNLDNFLEISKLPALKALNLSYSGLEFLPPILKFPTIQHLSVSGNNIRFVHFLEASTLPLLETLDLSNIGMNMAPRLGPYPHLKVLRLAVNSLQDVANVLKSDLPNLRTLDLGRGSLYFLRPITKFPLLEELILNDNTLLESLEFLKDSQLDHLQVVNIKSTLITDIRPLLRFKKLKKLDFTFVKFSMSYGFFRKQYLSLNFPNLEVLNLRGRRDSRIVDFIARSHLPNLKQLNIESNRIDSMEKIAQLNMPNLKSLSLADNKLRNGVLLRNFPLLSVLNLAYNQIRDFTFIKDSELNQLTTVILKRNQAIDEFPFSLMSNQKFNVEFVA